MFPCVSVIKIQQVSPAFGGRIIRPQVIKTSPRLDIPSRSISQFQLDHGPQLLTRGIFSMLHTFYTINGMHSLHILNTLHKCKLYINVCNRMCNVQCTFTKLFCVHFTKLNIVQCILSITVLYNI